MKQDRGAREVAQLRSTNCSYGGLKFSSYYPHGSLKWPITSASGHLTSFDVQGHLHSCVYICAHRYTYIYTILNKNLTGFKMKPKQNLPHILPLWNKDGLLVNSLSAVCIYVHICTTL